MLDLIEIAKVFGPTVAILIWFSYRDSRREKSLNKRIDMTDKWIKESLLPAFDRSNQVIAENNVILSGISQVLTANNSVLTKFAPKPRKAAK